MPVACVALEVGLSRELGCRPGVLDRGNGDDDIKTYGDDAKTCGFGHLIGLRNGVLVSFRSILLFDGNELAGLGLNLVGATEWNGNKAYGRPAHWRAASESKSLGI